LVIFIQNVESKTIIVDDYGDGDYEGIQEAINSANAGDTIRVWKGDYEDNIIVNEQVSIIGNGSRDTEITVYSGHAITLVADGCFISGLNIVGGGAGIVVESDNNIISNNIIEEIAGSGVMVRGQFSLISNNTFLLTTAGITFAQAHGNVAKNNVIQQSRSSAIDIDESSSCTLFSNSLDKMSLRIRGDSLEHWNTHTIPDNNTVDGKPVWYVKNDRDRIAPTNVADVIIANCTNVTVENFNFDGANYPILVGFSSNVIIRNNTISRSTFGVFFSTHSYSNQI